MTRLALGGKWGSPRSPPVLGSLAVSAAKPSLVSSVASAGMPMAIPAVLRRENWRRVIEALGCGAGGSESVILCLAFCYLAVMVSARFRVILAKVVQVAASRGPIVGTRFDS